MKPIRIHTAKLSDETRLTRWLVKQERLHAKFYLDNLREWLGDQNCFLAEGSLGPVGFLLYIQTSQEFATLLGLAADIRCDVDEVLVALLAEAWPVLHGRGVSHLSCVSAEEWACSALCRQGFEPAGRLATYLKIGGDIPDPGNTGVRVRPTSADDIEALVEVDAAAFEPIWRQNAENMCGSLQRSGYFIGVEWQGHLVGYASGSCHGDQGHISRLAIHPRFQRLGLGTRLLAESITHFRKVGAGQITLNTQEDNQVSRRMYERFGFHLVNCDTRVLIKEA
jgi:ribosomal-protein-alanine N-acetyltransferase